MPGWHEPRWWGRTRSRYPGLLAAMVVGVLAGSSAIAFVVAQGGSTTNREPEPSTEQILEDLPHIREALEEGTPVEIIPGTAPDPRAAPFMHGLFRIIPAGFTGELERKAKWPAPADLGPQTAVISEVRESPLWPEPAFLPSGFALTSAWTLDYLNLGAGTLYKGTGGDLTIARWREVETPVDVGLNLTDGSAFEFSFMMLADGAPAILTEAADGTYFAVRSLDESSGVVTLVEIIVKEGASFSADEIMRVAEGVN